MSRRVRTNIRRQIIEMMPRGGVPETEVPGQAEGPGTIIAGDGHEGHETETDSAETESQ